MRSLVGASLEVINKKRNEKSEVRQASREAALREVKVGWFGVCVWGGGDGEGHVGLLYQHKKPEVYQL